MKPALVILAAGVGSRYGGFKQIDPVGRHGEISLDYAVYDAWRAGFCKIVFVIRPELEAPIREHFAGKLPAGLETVFVFQELTDLPAGIPVPADRKKPWGTAQAVLSARRAVREPFAVINADDFYGPRSYQALADFLMATPVDSARPHPYAMVGFPLRRTLSSHGTVSRGVCRTGPGGLLESVVEHTKIAAGPDGSLTDDQGDGRRTDLPESTVVSMNMWGFTPALFPWLEQEFAAFLKARGGDLKAECYLPAVVDGLIRRGECTVRVLPTPEAWFGMTYPEDRPEVQASIRALADAGVYPEPLW